jgi:hypothetical protein
VGCSPTAAARRSVVRPALIVPFLLAPVLLPAFGRDPRGPEAARRQPVYGSDARADRLLALMFPTSIPCEGVTRAYASRGREPAFKDLGEVLTYHSQGMHRAARTPQTVEIADDHLESFWLTLEEDNGRAGQLLLRAGRVEELVRSLADSPPRFSTPLEKALLQRDIFQMGLLFTKAARTLRDADARRRAVRALRALASLWRTLWLRDEEFRRLTELRPAAIDRKRFTVVGSCDLRDDYLPQRVLSEDRGWYEVLFEETPASHFVDFHGRSFVRVFIKPPGMAEAAFRSYQAKLSRVYGTGLTRTGSAPPLPAKTETLLIRTFGVFLHDGTYADTGFPEEVVMRVFKYERTRVDLTTSDFRGTLFYQYKMRRRDLLREPRSLGLRRIRETEPQFFGFLSEVPDPRNATSETLTVMRNNCVGCHSEALYGVSTVFSLARRDPKTRKPGVVQGGLLEVVGKNRFRLKTPEFKQFQALTK